MKSQCLLGVALAAAMVGGPRLGPAAEPNAAAESKIRNVLFIVSDDLKASVLGCYGDEICDTPRIDALAAGGMVFERAYCQGTWCRPSRISFMHGRYAGKRGATLGEHLIEEGFYSARVGKIFHMRVPGDIIAGTNGPDFPETWTERFNTQGREAHTPGYYRLLNENVFTTSLGNRQSTRDPHRMFVSVEAVGDGSDQPDWKGAEKTVELLAERAEADEPFFLATGFVRPHYPSVAPASYFDDYPWKEVPMPEVPEGDLEDIPPPGRSRTTSESCGIARYPDNIRRMWADYYATVTFMDEQVGKVLDALEREGLRESTAVIFTSDHGYHLGEHHFWQKVNLHEEVTRVPLIISVPGFESGRSESLAELVDIYPTVCDLVGAPGPETLQGESLVPVLEDPAATVRDAALSMDREGHGIRTDGWAYMRYENGAEELYDMRADPGQFDNLAGDAAHEETRARLREVWEQRVAEVEK